MSFELIEGVRAEQVAHPRLSTRVLLSGPEDGIPVLFIHGNFSSATWWEETLATLPERYVGIAPDQRGYHGADPDAKIDATRGMGDFVDDSLALMDHLGHARFHIVGNSLGGLVVWWMMADAPERLLSATLAGPGSPFGFGGTRDAKGTPTTPDFAGSGGGLINPDLVRSIREGDRESISDFSPRGIMRRLVWSGGQIPKREDALIDAMFRVHIGDRELPGDFETSPHWPYVRPGKWGATNAMSPQYAVGLDDRILAAEPRPAVLWSYGADDLAVSNTAASDPGTWGPTGRLPGYPGPEAYPPQPMMDQIRRLLTSYEARGGFYREVAIEDSGHVPFITHPEEFNRAFHAHLDQNNDGE
ncbi:MAG: alpha/beta hydrolase [Gammaproteobacteria bacterium]|nr:alpha/beta hydrolase [Gammaproteobacteria bacterium]NNJ79923.1 alpha/beta hydrolase [Xanthomonadales bacterium]